MPHNLYLHSSIVQTRAYGESDAEKREALRYATLDSTIALMFALLINASILILAAASFHATGQTEVADLDRAHALLGPLLGLSVAPALFGFFPLFGSVNSFGCIFHCLLNMLNSVVFEIISNTLNISKERRICRNSGFRKLIDKTKKGEL